MSPAPIAPGAQEERVARAIYEVWAETKGAFITFDDLLLMERLGKQNQMPKSARLLTLARSEARAAIQTIRLENVNAALPGNCPESTVYDHLDYLEQAVTIAVPEKMVGNAMDAIRSIRRLLTPTATAADLVKAYGRAVHEATCHVSRDGRDVEPFRKAEGVEDAAEAALLRHIAQAEAGRGETATRGDAAQITAHDSNDFSNLDQKIAAGVTAEAEGKRHE